MIPEILTHAETDLVKMPAIFEAAMFATKRHGDQKRGGSDTPYVHHCFDVARRIVKHKFTETEMILAAILHDTIEDTDVTFEEIARLFGGYTANLVFDLTLPVEARKDRYKKQAFQLRKMRSMDFWGQALKVADKSSNVEDLIYHPPNWSLRAIRGYSEGAREVVLAMMDGDDTPSARFGMEPRLEGLVTEFLDIFERVKTKYGWENAEKDLQDKKS